MRSDDNIFLPTNIFGEVVSNTGAADGMSGATVRAVTTTQGRYVVRIYHGNEEIWQRSLSIQLLAADSGIAPPILHVDTERQAIVSQQIVGTLFSAAVSQPSSRQAALGSLAAILARLHALPVRNLPRLDALEFIQGTWASQFERPGFPAWAQPLAHRLSKIRDVLGHDGRRVLTHGDLNPTNILWDGGRAWLIDWDGAGLGHPYLDIATAADFLSFSDDTATSVLGMQEQAELNATQLQTFKDCRDLSRIAYGGVFLRLIPDLTQVTFPSLQATPTLSQCFARMAAGDLSMANMEGQALIAAAFFKQCE